MITNFIYMAIILLGSVLAYKWEALDKSGSLAAFLLGSVIILSLGIKGIFLLGLFFATSSIFSFYKHTLKEKVNEKLANGSRRNWKQVAANGAVAGIFSLLFAFNPNELWLYGFIAAIAAATADTWASEIGVLSKSKPIKISTLRRCEPGTSGAVSILGTVASILGSAMIVAFSVTFYKINLKIAVVLFLSGVLGSVIDTFIGAFLQVNYRCSVCSVITERKSHCGKPTENESGIKFIDNEIVNFGCIIFTSILCIMICAFST